MFCCSRWLSKCLIMYISSFWHFICWKFYGPIYLLSCFISWCLKLISFLMNIVSVNGFKFSIGWNFTSCWWNRKGSLQLLLTFPFFLHVFNFLCSEWLFMFPHKGWFIYEFGRRLFSISMNDITTTTLRFGTQTSLII